MPFRRRRRRRRVRRRKPTAMRAVRRLARFVDTELHVVHTVLTNPDILNVAIFEPLALIAQGDDVDQRDGLQVALRSIDLRFIIQSGTNRACVRFILFIDKQVNNNTAPLTLDDLMEETSTAIEALVSPINIENKRRFTILRDWTRTLVDQTQTDVLCFRVRKSLKTKVRYTGGAATLAETNSGMPFLFMFGTNTTAQTAPNVTMVCRTTFAP